MYCSNCGTEIETGKQQCSKCGSYPQQIVQQPVNTAPSNQDLRQTAGKSWVVTLLLNLFLGYLGVHRFYSGSVGIGVVQLMTGGLCGIWWFIDFVMIITNSYRDGNGNPLVK